MPGPLRIDIDVRELVLLVGELNAKVHQLGLAEAERRIGRPINDQYIRQLFEMTADQHCLRAMPTPEFDRLLLRLWIAGPQPGT